MTNTPRHFEVIELPEMVGKTVGEVQKYCEERYVGRLAKEEDLDAFEKEWEGKSKKYTWYFFMGSTVRGRDGDWIVPYAFWLVSGFVRDRDWLSDDWNAGCRVVLIAYSPISDLTLESLALRVASLEKRLDNLENV
jgi:hypothetical protein